MADDRLQIAVVMDPIEDIKPAKDTTLAMMLAAQRRGWGLSYLELGHLWLRDGVALGRAHPLDAKDWFSRGEPQTTRLGDFDVILMRKDPPFDTEYIYSTYILERAADAGALVVNRPQGLRDMNEKVYTAWFPECCAPTLITRDMADMRAFLRERGRVDWKRVVGRKGGTGWRSSIPAASPPAATSPRRSSSPRSSPRATRRPRSSDGAGWRRPPPTGGWSARRAS